MVIGDESARVEIAVREVVAPPAPSQGDVWACVTVVCGAFRGANPSVYIERDEWDAFAAALEALEALERVRAGEVVLRSESPNDLRLRVHARDRAGHLAVEGHVGTDVFLGGSSRPVTLAFAFELDPGLLPTAVRDAHAARAGVTRV